MRSLLKPDIMKICSADGGDNENGMMMIRPAARNLSLIFELDKRDPKTIRKETKVRMLSPVSERVQIEGRLQIEVATLSVPAGQIRNHRPPTSSDL